MAQGYAVIDLETLNPSKIKDVCLSKFVALVLQFISQRHRPVRGSALKLLLNYFRTSPCKTSFTAAGCYLCPAPGSRGTQVLVCCSVDSSLPLKMELFNKHSYEGQKHFFLSEVAQIIADGESYLDHLITDASNVHFLDIRSDTVLVEARRLNILSESTYRNILSLQRDETEHFRSKTGEVSDYELNEVETVGTSVSLSLQPGQIGYFMNRFLVKWEETQKTGSDNYSMDEAKINLGGESQHYYCSSCLLGHGKVVKMRHMIDADWLYLAKLLQCHHVDNSEVQRDLASENLGQVMGKAHASADYAWISARRALMLLKAIPLAARRSLPVLVNPQGQLLLSIPCVGFKHCPCLTVSADFRPRVPLGGGYSSFV